MESKTDGGYLEVRIRIPLDGPESLRGEAERNGFAYPDDRTGQERALAEIAEKAWLAEAMDKTVRERIVRHMGEVLRSTVRAPEILADVCCEAAVLTSVDIGPWLARATEADLRALAEGGWESRRGLACDILGWAMDRDGLYPCLRDGIAEGERDMGGEAELLLNDTRAAVVDWLAKNRPGIFTSMEKDGLLPDRDEAGMER